MKLGHVVLKLYELSDRQEEHKNTGILITILNSHLRGKVRTANTNMQYLLRVLKQLTPIG